MKTTRTIFKFVFILSMAVFAFSCSDDDDANAREIDKFLGSYDADITQVFFGIIADTTQEQYILFIEEPAGNTGNEISLRNPIDQSNVVPATFSGNDFIIQSNNSNITGNGTLSSDGTTIDFEYSAPQEVGWGTLTKR